MIEKLIYLTVTRPEITFVVVVLSRFMHQLRETHWLIAIRVLTYIKSCPGKGLVYRKHEHVRILDIQIQDMLVIEKTGSLLLSIAPLLEEI